MSKSYVEITDSINRGIAALRKAASNALTGFPAQARRAMKGGALSDRHKELLALAIGISSRCDGCIGFHAKALVRLGATREEVMETLAVAVYMGGGPSLMHAAEAVQAFDEFTARAAP